MKKKLNNLFSILKKIFLIQKENQTQPTPETLLKKIYKKYSKMNQINRKNIKKILNLLNDFNITKPPKQVLISLEFMNIEGWEIEYKGLIAFFPFNTYKELTATPTDFKLSIQYYLKLGWFFPPFLDKKFFINYALNLKSMQEDTQLLQLESAILTIYNEKYLAIAYTEIYKQVRYVLYKKSEILEAISAFMCGFTYSGITALLPTIEGIIRDLADITGNRSTDIGKQKLLKIIDDLLDDFINKSDLNKYDFIHDQFLTKDFFNQFHEQFQMIHAFRSFIENTLYVETQNSKDDGNLNRHAILHGFHNIYNFEFNFLRLISTIDMLAYIIKVKTNSGSLIFPKETPGSKKYESYFKNLKNKTSNIKKPSA